MARTINAPGYEINELDMSQYSRTIDNSFDNAPVCLVLGYGDQGENSVPRWVNTNGTFSDYFGNPSTEEEKYFYNAAIEILKRNGVCIAAKLPYDNNQANKYVATDLSISTFESNELSSADDTIKTMLSFRSNSQNDLGINIQSEQNIKLIDKQELEDYLSRTRTVAKNTMKIIDIRKTIMDEVDFQCLSTSLSSTDEDQFSSMIDTNDCLGIMPVVFTAANAMYYQGILSNNISPIAGSIAYREGAIEYTTQDSGAFGSPLINSEVPVYKKVEIDYSALTSNMSMDLTSDNTYDNAVANLAESQYPTIQWKDEQTLLRGNLKYVGIAVFKAYADKANNGKIAFKLVESFVGSPVRNSEPGSLMFIDDVVNEQSTYINVISNIDYDDYMKADASYAKDQVPSMLGFYQFECEKNIPNGDKIINDANTILNKLDNPNMLPIDIVVDAGMSTIAFSKAIGSNSVTELPSMENLGDKLSEGTQAWYKYLQTYNNFCANKRKDCMFIADMPKSFSLNGQSKIVNNMVSKTVRNNIIPMLRKLKKINTSYGAGYATWLRAADAYTGQQMWMPPSIKMASVYTYCDTYFHPWSAPAGLTRGVLNDVVDVSFNPLKQDCEQLYMNGWNYVLSYPMSGIVVEGQKTFQSEATALDRVNVRRLMLYIERRIAYIAKYFVYENNTPYQRQLFADQVNGILTQVRNGSGISEFAVKCDDTNNTPATIDRNELHLSVAVKPVKTIEFIVLQFALTSQSANVQETVARL